LRKGEVENLRVLGQALTMCRFSQDRKAVLDAPAEQDLRRRAPIALSNPAHRFI
jgi:hypothetical protein